MARGTREWEGDLEQFSWKGSTVIKSNCLTAFGLTKSYSMRSRVLSKCLLSTDSPGPPTTSPGSCFQCLTTLTVKEFP